MNKQMLSMALLYTLLILLQVLICNHIMLFHVAVPFIFIYFILRLPIGMSQVWELTLSFAMGLIIDLFSDTPGVNSLASTILAAIKPTVFYAYVTRDDKTKRIIPSLTSIGWQAYSKYALTMSVIFSFLVFSIEFLSFAGIEEILLMTVSSAVLTFALIIAIDSLVSANEKALV